MITATNPNTSAAMEAVGSSPCAECVQNCALIAAAVAKGNFARKISCPNRACHLTALVTSMNHMVTTLSNYTEEVMDVMNLVVEGKLGVQAKHSRDQGVWTEVASLLNRMTAEHSEQVRDIASVCIAVAHGDLSKKVTINVKGEPLVLKNTINLMVEQLCSFSSQVTRVAYKVETEGKLDCQAHVKGMSGEWKKLTDNFNTMAANLTTQARDIDSISTAVANGDYVESITVEAAGEMDSLKAKVNQMVYSLRESIRKNIAAREAAELSAHSKTELLVNMSHELRGPMNDIIGMTHRTLETELTPQQRENLMIVSNMAHS